MPEPETPSAAVRLLLGLDELSDAWLRLRFRLDWLPPVLPLTFTSLGDAERLVVRGRVVARPPLAKASADTPRWRNALAVLRRFAALDIPSAQVWLDRTGEGFGPRPDPRQALEVVADAEGYFRGELPPQPAMLADPLGWHDVMVELRWPGEPERVRQHAVARVLVPRAAARFAVISDMDDTVLHSGVTSTLTALQVTLLNNAQTRLPFPGVAAFYHALQESGPNPVVYVSGSPWMLYDLLEDFLAAQGVPAGPMELMRWGEWIQDERERNRYKLDRIERYLAALPRLGFVLIGDSGQRDPEIYAEVIRRHPGRVLAVYIRDVSVTPRDDEVRRVVAGIEAAGVPVVLSEDTLAAARHAAGIGLIDAAAVERVAAAVTSPAG